MVYLPTGSSDLIPDPRLHDLNFLFLSYSTLVVRLSQSEKRLQLSWSESLNVPTFYLYKLPVFSTRERVVEISYS